MTKTSLKSRSAHRLANHVSAAVDDSHLKGMVVEAKTALSNAGEHATDEIKALSERLRESLAGFQAQLKSMAKVVRRRASEMDDRIRTNPYQSLGIAAGAGLVAGYLISRRHSKS
jgi:ElaB/YqjD/DUF883 family membrane-anchored ribosome-binding protein